MSVDRETNLWAWPSVGALPQRKRSALLVSVPLLVPGSHAVLGFRQIERTPPVGKKKNDRFSRQDLQTFTVFFRLEGALLLVLKLLVLVFYSLVLQTWVRGKDTY